MTFNFMPVKRLKNSNQTHNNLCYKVWIHSRQKNSSFLRLRITVKRCQRYLLKNLNVHNAHPEVAYLWVLNSIDLIDDSIQQQEFVTNKPTFIMLTAHSRCPTKTLKWKSMLAMIIWAILTSSHIVWYQAKNSRKYAKCLMNFSNWSICQFIQNMR